ncbi:hypothetical protein ABG768_024703 [Culter alburnus]|uniref:Apolipoprotein L3 n=1 Tax=Culter alburnus TaxID=194366 RepID=A0AAW2AC57_CULAL
MKISIEELKSEYDRNHQTLNRIIKELNDLTDEVESVHKNSTVGSLVGSSIGAAGGIAALAGLAFSPFTFGASLALTGAGAVAGVAGGVTGAASNITNVIKQKNLRETIEKIINDFQNTVKPMIELLSEINNDTEDIDLMEQTSNKHICQRAARSAVEVIKIVKVYEVAEKGKTCAGAAKAIRAHVKAAKVVHATAETAKAIRKTAAITGGVSALFLALDVYCIVQDSAELSEMNQPADKRKTEEIKSVTLKFILHTRETAARFKNIVDQIEDTIDRYF